MKKCFSTPMVSVLMIKPKKKLDVKEGFGKNNFDSKSCWQIPEKALYLQALQQFRFLNNDVRPQLKKINLDFKKWIKGDFSSAHLFLRQKTKIKKVEKLVK